MQFNLTGREIDARLKLHG